MVAPAVVFGAGGLGVDEAVDALITDHLSANLAGEPAGDLFGGPACGEALENGAGQVRPPFQGMARPAPPLALFLSVNSVVHVMGTAGVPSVAGESPMRPLPRPPPLPVRFP